MDDEQSGVVRLYSFQCVTATANDQIEGHVIRHLVRQGDLAIRERHPRYRPKDEDVAVQKAPTQMARESCP